ncbi:DNA phosphorothioation-dependent restriction protein DptG [Agarivorans sp. MS3-6]
MNIDRHTYPINENLPQTAYSSADSEGIPNKNSLNSFLPIRTKGNEFNWDAVVGLVLRGLLRQEIKSYSFEQFEEACKSKFEGKLSNKDFWQVLQDMYFKNKDILSVSPEFSLFSAQKEIRTQSDQRIASLFNSLAQNQQIERFDAQVNFVEKEMLLVLQNQMKKTQQTGPKEAPYLPFLSQAFKQDIQFLATKPKYLLSEFQQLLTFYAFSYTAQLSLSIPDWKSGQEPKAKPLYFIMDHEKASIERTHIQNHGYKLFHETSKQLYPVLTMLELLQPTPKTEKYPLWKIAKDIESSAKDNLVDILRNFARAFRSQRNLSTYFQESESALDWLENIIVLANAQFADSTTERPAINKKYVNEVEKSLAKSFIQSRGRSGKVFVLNQDYVILLTNLVVGASDKLRFHELIVEFQNRGVFVDKQTELELISFYERIGNVERMSDSGDAVYVRKTI